MISGVYDVTFVVKESGTVITKGFTSPYKAKIFVNRIKRSKRCRLISYPIFD